LKTKYLITIHKLAITKPIASSSTVTPYMRFDKTATFVLQRWSRVLPKRYQGRGYDARGHVLQ